MLTTAYERFVERYREGGVPWDDRLPPPEVMGLVGGLEPGRALDLGCGYGRSAIYLAQLGWRVDGVGFVPQAIGEAERRAAEAGVTEGVRFHVGSVSELGFLKRPYDLAIDVGCMHALEGEGLTGYRDGLVRLLGKNGRFLLFARLRQGDQEPENGPRGILESVIHDLFATDFVLEKREVGETQTAEDKPAWLSGWFWFRRG